ncbi:MAG TPA: putative cytokinetic ring protein SteA, partial [Acidimicrobiales bacterium]|nr:putative cytokinetic ring protein SteA [Acidimicrobiales bacterium]
VRVEDGDVVVEGAVVGKGRRQNLQSLEHEYEQSKQAMGDELERFAENTLEYLRRERRLVVDPLPMPKLRTSLKGRHALIVVRGFDYKEDLAHLRSYVREIRPVLIGVDGGADALLECGLRPDLIIGDFDSVSANALLTGAELVVHAYPGGAAPGAERLEGLGLSYKVLEAPGTSEDIAMLLADEKGADLLVAVGTHASMVEFLDKGRAGMASTFLVRLKVGEKLVDAKGVSRLYESRIRKRDMTFFLLAAMLCFIVVVVALTPRVFLEGFWLSLREAWRSVVN